MTAKQWQFVALCEEAGLKINHDYSGRDMYGKTCPSVQLNSLSEFPGNPYQYKVDQLGLGYVVYAP